MSEVFYQITDTDAEGFGNFGKRFQVNPFFRALNLTNVIPSQTGFFSKFFLAEGRPNTFVTDSFSQDFIKAYRRWHVNTEPRNARAGYQPPVVFFMIALPVANTI
jgi:hypothetical protein